MTFEAPQNSPSEEVPRNPAAAQEVPLNMLEGADLEIVFKAGGIKDEELTAIQRFELYDKGYEVTLPEGEATLSEKGITLH